MADLTFGFSYTFIFGSCILGFLYGIYNWYMVMSIDINRGHNHENELKRPLVDQHFDSFGEMVKISELIQNVNTINNK